MYQIIHSVDYEIHGNGDGCPLALMVEPTSRIMKLFNEYGAKLTIFADVAEILKFKEYYERTGNDHFYYGQIENQLKQLIKEGHDVQLHLHSSYFKAKYNNGKWEQCWEEYDLAKLPFETINEYIHSSKLFLEKLLKPVDMRYECNVFRAANWSMVPTRNIANALISNGFVIDSSVFKYGKRAGRVSFDYSEACNDILPWAIDPQDINKQLIGGKLIELPIYSELRFFWSFVTIMRIFRMIRAKFHKHKEYSIPESDRKKDGTTRTRVLTHLFLSKHAWKMDLNQASGKMLIDAFNRVVNKSQGVKHDIPIVLIGHSKTFIKYNSHTLSKFLRYIRNQNIASFALYKEINLESLKYHE